MDMLGKYHSNGHVDMGNTEFFSGEMPFDCLVASGQASTVMS